MSESPIRGVHDLGGLPGAQIDRREHELSRWEKAADATLRCVMERGVRVDEFRHAIEELPASDYRGLSYYERWIASLYRVGLRRGMLTEEEVAARVAVITAERRNHGSVEDHAHEAHDHEHHDDEDEDGEYPVLGDALRDLLIGKGFFSAAEHRAVLERISSQRRVNADGERHRPHDDGGDDEQR